MMRTLTIWTAVLTCALAWSADVQARTATVEFYIGELNYAIPPDTVFTVVTLGQVLYEGTYLRTGTESRGEVRLDDGTLLRLQETTFIQLYATAPDTIQPPPTVVSLNSGEIFVIKGRVMAGEEFQVRTPIAVAAIRGTEFKDRMRGGENEVQVLRGAVDFFSSLDGRMLRIARGQAGRIMAGFAPAARELTNEELAALLDLSGGGLFQGDTGGEPGGDTEPGDTGDAGEETGKVDAPEQADFRTGDSGVGYGATVGAVLIDGRLVNQFGLRPEFTIGKVGIGLDLSLYFDADGQFLDEYWDEPEDYLDKIYYIRYAQKGEPFYVRAGALEEVTLGYGLIMRDYSNTMQYPSTIRVGTELGINRNQLMLEAMFANFRELDEPGLFGGRLAYRPLRLTAMPLLRDLEIGATAVVDGNQYAATENDLDDDLKDLFDPPLPDYNGSLPDSLYTDRSVLMWGADAGMPLLRSPVLDVDVYAQFAQVDGYGHGLTLPGFRAAAGPLRMEFEYCIFGEQFMSNYFNRSYDLQRVMKITRNYGATPFNPFTQKEYVTKEEFLSAEYDSTQYHGGNNGQFQDSKQGWYGGVGLNLINMVDFWGTIQLLGSGDTRDESGYLEAVVNTTWIPGISLLSAYAQQSHVPDLFEFERGPWTVWGANIGYEIAPGASIIMVITGTYQDIDNDGVLDAVKTTNLQTAIQF